MNLFRVNDTTLSDRPTRVIPSTNPTMRGFQDRSLSISNRITALVNETNASLNAVDGPIITPKPSMGPKGTCKCDCFLIICIWAVKCCKKSAERILPNKPADNIIQAFKTNLTTLYSEIEELSQETDTSFPPSAIERGKSCRCWCITVLGIPVYCKWRKACCESDTD